MRHYLAAIAWAIVLGVFTCTRSLEALLFQQKVHFHLIAHPSFRELLITSDANFTDPYWLFVKLGHFTGFGFLDLLLSNAVRNQKLSAAIAILFAIATEILQLYFGRDGRLTDMIIDSAGVLLFYYLIKTPDNTNKVTA
jgi:VanZ family protein